MDFMLTLEKAASGKQGGSGGTLIMILYLVVIFGAMYFMLIRPQRKKQKEEKKMRENLQVGDEIVTIGGVHGRIIALKEDTFVVESKSDHSKLTFSRWAIQQNLTVHDSTEK
ncbi:MAG: preprotein translocase subunit YajC [Oscillospiraceae bacterium]|nr:preprotein translocase subunit YajC [Oscillospiraceae bacterium]